MLIQYFLGNSLCILSHLPCSIGGFVCSVSYTSGKSFYKIHADIVVSVVILRHCICSVACNCPRCRCYFPGFITDSFLEHDHCRTTGILPLLLSAIHFIYHIVDKCRYDRRSLISCITKSIHKIIQTDCTYIVETCCEL